MKSSKKIVKVLFLLVVALFVFINLLGISVNTGIFSSPPGCVKPVTVNSCRAKYKVPLQISYSLRKCLKIETSSCFGPNIVIENSCGSESKITVIGRNLPNIPKNIFDLEGWRGINFTIGFIDFLPFWNLSYVTSDACS